MAYNKRNGQSRSLDFVSEGGNGGIHFHGLPTYDRGAGVGANRSFSAPIIICLHVVTAFNHQLFNFWWKEGGC